MIPSKIFLTSGWGYGKEPLEAHEAALKAAGIAPFNLVKVSSIIPPGAEIISKEIGLVMLNPGEIVYAVLAHQESNEQARLVAAAIGLAIPKERHIHGYLSEYHGFGKDEKEAKDYAEDLAATMLAATLGIKFDIDKAYDESRDIYKLSGGEIINSQSVAVSVPAHRGGWTGAVAAAILLP